MQWYNIVTQDLSRLPDFLQYYENELRAAALEVRISGNLEKNNAMMPGIVNERFTQLQEIEAVLEFMNKQLTKISRKHFKNYLETYNRALTSRDAEKYAEGEDEVIEYELLINEVALVRNKFLGVIKSLEVKNFMLSNIVKLRAVGMEDISI